MESLAQMGVQLLLFTLGLEFSLNKLRAVRSVAVIGERPSALCLCTLCYSIRGSSHSGIQQQIPLRRQA